MSTSLYIDKSLVLRIAQAVGITATAFLAGQEASTTYLFTPALLDSPAPLLARQWKKVWLNARSITAPVSIMLSILFGYLSYKDKSTSKYFLTTSILLLAQLPYSALLIAPLNRRLSSKADSLAATALSDAEAEVGVTKADTVHALVDKWAMLYMGKSLMVVVAAASAAWGSL